MKNFVFLTIVSSLFTLNAYSNNSLPVATDSPKSLIIIDEKDIVEYEAIMNITLDWNNCVIGYSTQKINKEGNNTYSYGCSLVTIAGKDLFYNGSFIDESIMIDEYTKVSVNNFFGRIYLEHTDLYNGPEVDPIERSKIYQDLVNTSEVTFTIKYRGRKIK